MVKIMKKHIKFIIAILLLTSCQSKSVSSLVNGKVYYHYKTVEPYLCLTFDDGPRKNQTLKTLSILKKYNIKATFFVVGENIEYQKDVLKQVYEQGHEIGNHMYAHENINKISKQEIKESIIKTNKLIKEVTGKDSKIIRPPYGIVNDTLKEICDELDMDIILWTDDKDSKDWELIPESEIINNVTKKVSNGDIFLFHDGNEKYKNTLSAIDVIIPQLQKKGYKWVTVSTLINKK